MRRRRKQRTKSNIGEESLQFQVSSFKFQKQYPADAGTVPQGLKPPTNSKISIAGLKACATRVIAVSSYEFQVSKARSCRRWDSTSGAKAPGTFRSLRHD